MLLVIDHHTRVPAYRPIMEQIRLQIGSGILKADDEIPSTRALSVTLSLNPMTISKAYGLLERDGVLERRRGQTLVVRAHHADDVETEKLDQLRHSLPGAASVARQLGLSPAQAVRVFREVLDQAHS
jgi:GntR family transcriptional regulator